jgi:hypothetical protein
MTPTSWPLYVDFTVDLKGRSVISVHVGTQCHDRARLPAAQHGNHAGLRDIGFHLEPERPQMIRDDFRRARLTIRQFRMLVNVAPPLDDLGHDQRHAPVDLALQRLSVRVRRD